MLISGFHIDGFGIYHDQGVRELPAGLVLFVGDNESGKTTLMAFIRNVLFGFKRKGSGNDYLPWRGGSHGGRLSLCLKDGRRVTVERIGRHATISEGEGAPRREEPAVHLLGGIDRATFEHIFAVGLDDLQGLEVLTQEGVLGRLFSASAGLGAASVPAALKSINDELGTLWAPRAKKRLNQLTERLRDIAKKIQDLQGQAAAYAACQAAKEELEARVLRERREMEDIRHRLRRLEQLEQARGPWAVLLTAQQREDELREAKDFPPYGLEQWEHLKGDVEKIRLNLKDREAEAARLQARLDKTVVDEALLAQREGIERLLGEREKIAAAVAGLPALRHALGRADEEFTARLKDLGPDWDAARLPQVDTSVAVRQQVQAFGHRLDVLERRMEHCQSQERFLEEEMEDSRRRLEEEDRRLAQAPRPPLRDVQELQEKRQTISLLQALCHRREVVDTRLQDRHMRREEVAARLTSLKNQLAAPYGPIPWWTGIFIILVGFLLDVLLSLKVSHLAGNAVFLLAFLAAVLIMLACRRQLMHERRRRTHLDEEVQQAESMAQALGAEIARLESHLAALNRDMAEQSLKVADAPLENPADLEHLAAGLDQAAQQLHEWQVLVQEKDRSEKHLEDSRGRLLKARQESEEAAHDLQEEQSRWRSWATDHGFPEEVRPEAFEAIFQAVERAREAAQKVADLRLRLKEAETYLAEAKARIASLLEACGLAATDDEPDVGALDTLRRALADALEVQRTRRELENSLAASQEHTAHLAALLQDKERELQHLRQQAGAGDEEEFRRLAALHQDWRECLRRKEQSEIALLNIAGNPAAQESLMEELRQTDSLAVETEKEELTTRLAVLSESVPRALQEVGRLGLELSQMAQDEKLGDLLQEQSICEEQLQEAMRRWAVLAVSRHLVESACSVYERERQPQVIREAGRFLGSMTGDRYRLVSPPGEQTIQLEDTSLKRKGEIHWSDGLADQVYLAVRLGLAREFSRHAEPLPVILDDVLVKFDPRRRRGAARVILEFAREQQVFLFTCHPEFQKIIASLQQENYFQETPVSFFHIADGTIQRARPDK